MILTGLVLLLVGLFLGISILSSLGAVLLVIGVVLTILGSVGRPVGGRNTWW